MHFRYKLWKGQGPARMLPANSIAGIGDTTGWMYAKADIAGLVGLENWQPEEITESEFLDVYITKVPKLTIRRALRAMGQEAQLDTILTVPEFKKDWDDAAEIDLSETMVKDALKQMSISVDLVKRLILGL